jgi:hypothetical protein
LSDGGEDQPSVRRALNNILSNICPPSDAQQHEELGNDSVRFRVAAIRREPFDRPTAVNLEPPVPLVLLPRGGRQMPGTVDLKMAETDLGRRPRSPPPESPVAVGYRRPPAALQ